MYRGRVTDADPELGQRWLDRINRVDMPASKWDVIPVDVGSAEKQVLDHMRQGQAAVFLARETLKDPSASLDDKAAARETIRLWTVKPLKKARK